MSGDTADTPTQTMRKLVTLLIPRLPPLQKCHKNLLFSRRAVSVPGYSWQPYAPSSLASPGSPLFHHHHRRVLLLQHDDVRTAINRGAHAARLPGRVALSTDD